jgi:26S proteasome regulatory subunit N1
MIHNMHRHVFVCTNVDVDVDAQSHSYVVCVHVCLLCFTLHSLGLAYAGTQNEEVIDLLNAVLLDESANIEVVSFSALAIGLVCAGSADGVLGETMFSVMLVRSEDELKQACVRYLCLGIGLVYLQAGEAAEVAMETARASSPVISEYCLLTIMTCAYMGSGNVLKMQELLSVCGVHQKEKEVDALHQSVAVLGLAMVSMGESVGKEMSLRMLEQCLQYDDSFPRSLIFPFFTSFSSDCSLPKYQLVPSMRAINQ